MEKGQHYEMEEKKKKPFYKRIWFIILIIIIIAGIGMTMGGESDSPQNAEPDAAQQQEEKITYEAYDVDQLLNDLDNNAMKASETYKDQYVKLTGFLGTIDSDGSYISIMPLHDEFAILGVQCYLTDDAQKKVISELSSGDKIIVKGKITEVGEIMGYSLDMDAIKKAK